MLCRSWTTKKSKNKCCWSWSSKNYSNNQNLISLELLYVTRLMLTAVSRQIPPGYVRFSQHPSMCGMRRSFRSQLVLTLQRWWLDAICNTLGKDSTEGHSSSYKFLLASLAPLSSFILSEAVVWPRTLKTNQPTPLAVSSTSTNSGFLITIL